MDLELRKKLIVPFTVFIAVLGVNVNTIISAINNHQPWRVAVACISSLIIIAAGVLVLRSIKNNNKKTS